MGGLRRRSRRSDNPLALCGNCESHRKRHELSMFFRHHQQQEPTDCFLWRMDRYALQNSAQVDSLLADTGIYPTVADGRGRMPVQVEGCDFACNRARPDRRNLHDLGLSKRRFAAVKKFNRCTEHFAFPFFHGLAASLGYARPNVTGYTPGQPGINCRFPEDRRQ